MPLRLRVIPPAELEAGDGRSPTTERIVEFPDEVDEIRIGRRANLDLSLPFAALSGEHARLLRKRTAGGERGALWMLEDLDSKNGTFVGNDRLRPGEQRLMLAGTQVDLAHVRLVFDGPSQPMSGAEGTATIARRLVSDLFHGSPGANAPTLSVIAEEANVTTLKLVDRDRPYFLGRSKDCDLCINIDELSRKHASFTRGWNGVVMRDLGSKNGIRVNGIVVTAQRICDGDLIEMGPLKLRLMDPEERYLRDLEGNPERVPAGDSRPPARVVMPPGLAVSPAAAVAVPAPPPAPPPPAAAGPPSADSAEKPIRRSRLAPPPGAAVPESPHRLTLDENHPALAARRPPPDARPKPPAEGDRSLLHRPRVATFIAAAVLAAIAAVVLVLALAD